MTVMEQMLYRFHVRTVSTLTVIPKPIRVLIEVLMFSSILVLVALICHLHSTHISKGGGGCMSDLYDQYSASSTMENTVLKINLVTSNSLSMFDTFERLVTNVVGSNLYIEEKTTTTEFGKSCEGGPEGVVNDNTNEVSKSGGEKNQQLVMPYLFGFNKGLLYLKEDVLEKTGVDVKTVTVDLDSNECISTSPMLRKLFASTFHAALQNHMVMNWMADISRRKGYLRVGEVPLVGRHVEADISPIPSSSSSSINDNFRNDGVNNNDNDETLASSHDYQDDTGGASTIFVTFGTGNNIEPSIADLSRTTNILSYWFHSSTVLFKVCLVFTSFGIILATNTVVTSTLKETQERMIKFTFLLHHHINRHISHLGIVIQHMVESTLMHLPVMIGIHLCLLEFFREHFLALLIFGVYWLEEIYCAVCVRSVVSIKWFRKFSFSIFMAYNMYFFCFPFGFAYLAFSVELLSMVLLMMLFFNHSEVAALESKSISVLHPRAAAGVSVGTTYISTSTSPSSPLRRSASNGAKRISVESNGSNDKVGNNTAAVEDMFGDD